MLRERTDRAWFSRLLTYGKETELDYSFNHGARMGLYTTGNNN